MSRHSRYPWGHVGPTEEPNGRAQLSQLLNTDLFFNTRRKLTQLTLENSSPALRSREPLFLSSIVFSGVFLSLFGVLSASCLPCCCYPGGSIKARRHGSFRRLGPSFLHSSTRQSSGLSDPHPRSLQILQEASQNGQSNQPCQFPCSRRPGHHLGSVHMHVWGRHYVGSSHSTRQGPPPCPPHGHTCSNLS